MKVFKRLVLSVLFFIFMPALIVNAKEEDFFINNYGSDYSFNSCYKSPNIYQIDNNTSIIEHKISRDSFGNNNLQPYGITDDDYNISIWKETESIAQPNTYKLYYKDLKQGQYFQARLEVPNDVNVDYDLVLYDSNLSILKYSNMIPVSSSNSKPVEESVGYVASSDERVYIAVWLYSNNNDSLTYTITTAISDTNADYSGLINDNVNESFDTQLNYANFNVARKIVSPIDVDWFKFTVIDDINYSKIRLLVTKNKTPVAVNECEFDLYQNLATGAGNYALLNIASGNGGELTLSPGEYYLRVRSAESLSNFDLNNAITSYSIEIGPESPVDDIKIISITGPHANMVTYNEGEMLRIEADDNPSYIEIYGRATYIDDLKLTKGAYNIRIKGDACNTSYEELNQLNLAHDYGEARTNSSGYFTLRIYLKSGIGSKSFPSSVSLHHYDVVELNVKKLFDDYNVIQDTESFYYLIYCT